MTFRGRGLRAMQFMTFSFSVKLKKQKVISAFRLNILLPRQ